MGRDLRRYAKQTNVRLFAGFFALLFLVGIGLIYIFYGQRAALMGLLCLFVAVIPVALIWFVFAVLDIFVKRDD